MRSSEDIALTGKEKDWLKALRRRADFLSTRIAKNGPRKNGCRDTQELHGLAWAISIIEDQFDLASKQ